MALHHRIQAMRKRAEEKGRPPVPDSLRGVTKRRIEEVLSHIDRNSLDLVDAVFALLDDVNPSWFTKAPEGARFCDGATTAHVGCHVGILQRGKGKLDREGRDYWLKPLWEIGAIEKVYLHARKGEFLPGHPVAKSSNSAYRLADGFAAILEADDEQWQALLDKWIEAKAVRQRLELQAELQERSRRAVDTKHSDLIKCCIEYYVPQFLPGFDVVYVDDGDGDRITEEDKRRLAGIGIEITLADAMPDVLLWNAETDALWVVEAVTSDGEADIHKVRQMEALASRSGKSAVGFTTAYPTWRVAANRQGKHKNICGGTYVWIAEDPARQLKVHTAE